MRLFIFLLLQFFIFLPLTSLASGGSKGPITQQLRDTESQKTNIKKTYGKLPLYIIENQGQVDSRVKIYERGAGHATFFTGNGLILSLTVDEAKVDKASHHDELKTDGNVKITTETLELSFVGANDRPVITAQDRQTGYANYFVGNDKTKWRSNIPTYGALTYKDVYKNIDIKFYGNNREIEHDVIVRPGGDPSMVIFAYKGAQGLKINKSGDLVVSLKRGNIIERKPVIYQEIHGERVAVEGSYKILKMEEAGLFSYGFTVASYDGTKDLVIDPVLSYSTYLGGLSVDHGLAIAVDNTGAVYVTGYTASLDFPLAGSIQGVIGGGIDVFITKINASGSAVIYSTYLGGTGDDFGFGVAVDNTGAAYLTGYTKSSDFPVVTPALGALGIGGVFDAFVTKINPAGSAIVYSTYLGGTGEEWGRGIAVDSAGAAYVTGNTASADFPLMNPIQPTFAGLIDAFITKVNPAGSAYVYSTYLGGAGADYGNGIAVDSSGNAYVAGHTNSTDFPLAAAIQGANAGVLDVFVLKINPAGSSTTYSTYLGGASSDLGLGIAVDSTGTAYIAGYTFFADFPLATPHTGNLWRRQ